MRFIRISFISCVLIGCGDDSDYSSNYDTSYGEVLAEHIKNDDGLIASNPPKSIFIRLSDLVDVFNRIKRK